MNLREPPNRHRSLCSRARLASAAPRGLEFEFVRPSVQQTTNHHLQSPISLSTNTHHPSTTPPPLSSQNPLPQSIFGADTIHRYSPLDSLQMSSLFSPSSSPSVVLCLSESEMEKGTQLNSAFYDASLNPDLSTVVTFITLDCESKMLNGDVINQKYSLDLTIKPATVFMTNSPGSKKIIKFKGSDLKSGAHLSKGENCRGVSATSWEYVNSAHYCS